MKAKPIEKLLTVKEAADILRVRECTILGWIKNKKLTHYRMDRMIRIHPRSIQRLIERSKVANESQIKPVLP